MTVIFDPKIMIQIIGLAFTSTLLPRDSLLLWPITSIIIYIFTILNQKLLTDSQIIERRQSGSEFAVQKVVRLIDSAHTGICIVVCIHAETKWLIVPQWSRTPMAAVMTAVKGYPFRITK